MVIAEKTKAFDKVKELNQERTVRVKQLKAAGKKIIGYLCLHPVLEMLTAFDLVPFRVLGDMGERVTRADTCMPPMVCPFLRSCLDLALKDKYAFLDGVVMAHICDVGERMAHIWRTYKEYNYFYFMDVPHTVHPPALDAFKEEIKGFQSSLESFVGEKLRVEKLEEAIELHNEQRKLIRELYDLRKPAPPLITGSEVLQVIIALASIPVDEGNELLRRLITEVHERRPRLPEKKARLMIWGSVVDNVSLIEMMEGVGASVVMDDLCLGTRAYWESVEMTPDPLDGLAYRYLVGIRCPRTLRETALYRNKKDYAADLEHRFGYLRSYIREWNVKGVILQSVKYCDTHGYEVPAVKDYLQKLGVPSIYLEHDYSYGSLAPLRTRVQAFLEILK